MRGLAVSFALLFGLPISESVSAAPVSAAPVAAVPSPDDKAVADAEQRFAQELAREHALDADAILATLAKAHYQQAVIDAITRPAEAKPWKEYRPIFLTERRIADGVAFYRANAQLLKRVEADYGVPAELIVTILGVETNYGHATGRFRVLDALTTLAFHFPPRQDYFRGELKQLFLLRGPNFPYAPDELTGSYAGAMGWGQFMPSSIAKFARDGDGDGKVDLWNSPPDIFASVANYFVAHGWQKDGPIALRAAVTDNARVVTPATLEPVYPLQQLSEWGYLVEPVANSLKPDSVKPDSVEPDSSGADSSKPGAPKTLDPMTPATLVNLDGADGPEAWVVFENFYAISRYNRSALYSLAVFQLSQAIAAEVAKEPTPP